LRTLKYRLHATAAPPASRSLRDPTLTLQQIDPADLRAAEKILPLAYAELRQLAAAKMARESPGLTLQPTALVHEAWLRLGGEAQPAWQNRAHFFAAAAEAMRRILIERARRVKRVRHGGELARADPALLDFIAAPALHDDRLLIVNEALEKFAVVEPRKAELVKLRYFAGLTLEEAADTLGIPHGTAKHWWTYARAWLFREIAPAGDPV
jgi:RNA polymerase sigma factor (TIGR02999 family)